MMIVCEGHVFRWRGGTFIAVWRSERADMQIPDDMIELPASLNRSKATRDDIERIARNYKEGASK